MKKLLSILGAVGLTTTGVSPVLANSPIQKNANNNHQEANLVSYQKELVSTMSSIINDENEITIKNSITSALKFDSKNEKIIIDKNLINEIDNQQVISLLSDSNFEVILNEMLTNGQLVITLNEKVEFKNEEKSVFAEQKFWVETHWYWFGYLKVHLGSDVAARVYENMQVKGIDAINALPILIRCAPELIPWSVQIAYSFVYSFSDNWFGELTNNGKDSAAFDAYGAVVIHWWSEAPANPWPWN